MIQARLNYGAGGVPHLYDSEIDEYAEALIREYNPELLTKPEAIDVEDFAESYLGLNLDYRDLSHDRSVLGCAAFKAGKIPIFDPENPPYFVNELTIDAPTIIIDNGLLNKKNEHAFRSTMMHECGHFVYHKSYYLNVKPLQFSIPWGEEEEEEKRPGYISCEEKDIIGEKGNQKRPLKTERDWIEHQANYFSAAALMPRVSVRTLFNDKKVREYCLYEHTGQENDAFISVLSKRFNVSNESARIRMRALNLKYPTKFATWDSYYETGDYRKMWGFATEN